MRIQEPGWLLRPINTIIYQLLHMKKLTLLLVVVSCSLRLSAQDNSIELKTLINSSFSYFPQFKELGQAINVEQQRIELAKAAGLPTVQAIGSYRYMDPVSQISIPTATEPISFNIMPNHNYSTMINASYTLWDFGVVKASVEQAKAGLRYANDNMDFNKNQMAYQVANIYYQIAYLRYAIAIQDSVINFLTANKKDTEIKFKHGDALKYDVLSIQSTIDQELNRKIELQTSMKKQNALMEYSTGFKTEEHSNSFIFPMQTGIDANSALDDAKSNNVEFKLIADQIQRSEAALKLSLTSGKPSLKMNAGTGYTNGYAPEIDKFKFNYTAGVTLNVPIYMGGQAKKQVRLSRSELAQSKIAEETLTNNYKKDIEQALIDVNSNQSSLLNALHQVTEAKEAQRLAQSRYKNGIGTYLELTNASTNVQRAELTQLQYKYELCIAQLTVAKLTGLKYW